jgi:hypothetical protein
LTYRFHWGMSSAKFTIFGCILILITLLSYVTHVSFDDPLQIVQNHKRNPSYAHHTLDQTFMPSNWSGLPISYGNTLFSNYSGEIPIEACNLLGTLEGDNITEQLIQHYREWIPIVGFNGIQTCMLEYDIVSSSMLLHMMGTALAEFSPSPPQFLVQVNSRDIFHNAGLHGAVWHSMEIYGLDQDNLLEFVDQEICYFKNSSFAGDIWVSCVHGVGHALGENYGTAGILRALEICAKHPDWDWKYTCASGVFMVLADEFSPDEWEPCDRLMFPAACFRFKKKKSFDLIITGKAGTPCEEFSDLFYQRGCIWSFAYIAQDNFAKCFRTCSKFLTDSNSLLDTSQREGNFIVCVEGYYHGNRLANKDRATTEEKLRSCEKFTVERAKELCVLYSSFDRASYNASSVHWWGTFDILELQTYNG